MKLYKSRGRGLVVDMRFLSAEWETEELPGLRLSRRYCPEGPVGCSRWVFHIPQLTWDPVPDISLLAYQKLSGQKFKTRQEALEALEAAFLVCSSS